MINAILLKKTIEVVFIIHNFS